MDEIILTHTGHTDWTRKVQKFIAHTNIQIHVMGSIFNVIFFF